MRKENVVNKKSLSSPNVSIGDLQRTRRFVMKQQTTCVEDSRLRPSGMTGLFYHGNNAFTLIELLVVVLIIGILASVALPQYQKAVWKSRAVQLITLAKSLSTAQETYHMASGEWASGFSDLDLEFEGLTPQTTSNVGMGVQGQEDKIRGNDWTELAVNNMTDVVETAALFSTGPYRGAGFIYVHKDPTNTISPGLYCSEGIPYISPSGKFCQQVWKSPTTSPASWYGSRFYQLP